MSRIVCIRGGKGVGWEGGGVGGKGVGWGGKGVGGKPEACYTVQLDCLE